MQLRSQLNLHLCASDRGVSKTRDETTRKNIDVSLREVQCLRSRAVDRILIYQSIYVDPTRIYFGAFVVVIRYGRR